MGIFNDLKKFDEHEEIKIFHDSKSGLEGVIAFHKKRKGYPSLGSTSINQYTSFSSLINDALKGSRINSLKAALSDLPYGGAKCILNFSGNTIEKTRIIQDYAKILNDTPTFITNEGSGFTKSDIRQLSQTCTNVVGLVNHHIHFSSHGIFQSLLTLSLDGLSKKTIVLHGLTRAATSLIKYLIEEKCTVYITDTNEETCTAFLRLYPSVKMINYLESHLFKTDFFITFINIGIKNKEFVESVNTKHIFCVMPLFLTENEADYLYKKNILYYPSFLINAGDILFAAYEYEHKRGVIDTQLIYKTINSIRERIKYITMESKMLHTSPYSIALSMAKEKIKKEYINQNQLELALDIDQLPII
jgi:leucine dehydrogenase